METVEYPEGAVKILDKGFVKLVDVMGDDSSIVQAARVSYGKGTKQVNEDRGLIRYLLRHAHTTPFEMVEFKFHCRMPIFVARQWIRHRTASVNEVSGRYSEMKDMCYVPNIEQITSQSKTNKQGGTMEVLSDAQQFIDMMEDEQKDLFLNYNVYLQNDMRKELARINLPLSTYTEWYWKIDLHNLMHFLRLRLDSHAQYEIRVFGEAMAKMVQEVCPLAWEAFEDYKLNAMNLSSTEVMALQSYYGDSKDVIDWELFFGNKRETEEFKAKLNKILGVK